MRVLVTGSAGQLAREFLREFERRGVECAAPPEAALDITRLDSVRAAVAAARPDVVINGAAYNAVDRAETEPAVAMKVNADGVRHLAVACRERGALLVHYGSDYVFDGEKRAPYVEDDPTRPINRYGESKLAGERAVEEEGGRALLLRLSWVYGPGPQNFLYKLLTWSEGKPSLSVVYDQISTPTYTADIVRFTLAALEAGLTGRFHLTNSGYATRYEVARHFFRCLGRSIVILPVPSSAFPSPARRPFFSALDNARLAHALGAEIPSWEDALARALPFVARP